MSQLIQDGRPDAEVVLHIGSWSSHCGACGRGADPHAETHDVALGYFPQDVLADPDHPLRKGCGARWTAVTSDYLYADVLEVLRRMRPDLPIYDPHGVLARHAELAHHAEDA